jgi:hypothetical protein
MNACVKPEGSGNTRPLLWASGLPSIGQAAVSPAAIGKDCFSRCRKRPTRNTQFRQHISLIDAKNTLFENRRENVGKTLE